MNCTLAKNMLDKLQSRAKQDQEALSALASFFCTFKQAISQCKISLSQAKQTDFSDGNRRLCAAMQPFLVYISKLEEQFERLVFQLDNEMIDPLAFFKQNLDDSVNRIIEISRDAHLKFSDTKLNLQIAKDEYFATAEKVNNKAKKPSKTAMVSKTMNKYMNQVQEANTKWDELHAIISQAHLDLDLKNRNNLQFVHSLHLSFAQLCQSLLRSTGTFPILKNLHGSHRKTNTDLDILRYSESIQEDFISFYEWKRLQDEIKDVISAKNIIANNLKCFTYDSNCPHSDSLSKKPANHSFINELVRTLPGRSIFLKVLERRAVFSQLFRKDMSELAMVFSEVLNLLDLDQKADRENLCTLVAVASRTFSFIEDRKVFLANYLKDNKVWTSKATWVLAIEQKVQSLLENDMNRPRWSNRAAKLLRGITRSLFNPPDYSIQRATTAVISEFKLYMRSFDISNDFAFDIIGEVSRKVRLDFQRLCLVLSEFKIGLTDEFQVIPTDRTNKWGTLLPFARALGFLEWTDLLAVLQVCKTWHNAFKTEAYKQGLVRLETSSGFGNPLRSFLWRKLLQTDTCDKEYTEVLAQVQSHPGCIEEFSKIIDADIERSFRNQPGEVQAAHKNILQAVAYASESTGYCQGMNFISGMLFSQFGEETVVFRSFFGLLNNLKMRELLDKKLSESFLYFYKIDRLVSILLPEVHAVFALFSISSVHYASSWILTIFSMNFENDSPELLKVWDCFIARGWKVIFKLVISILMMKQSEIVLKNYEELMATLNGEYQQICFGRDLLLVFNSVHIPNKMLKALDEEYQEIVAKAEIIQRG